MHRLHLRDLLAVIGVEQVDRLLADDAGHNTVAGRDGYALTNQHLRVPAANACEAEETRVLDVRNDQADLIDVTDDRERRAVAGRGYAGG